MRHSGSDFSLKRMVKVTYNNNDRLLIPETASLINGEYLSNEDTPSGQGIEFLIPDDFDGKLGFVFYQADLKELQITATYK